MKPIAKRRRPASSGTNPIWAFREAGGLGALAAELSARFLANFPKEKDLHFFHHTYEYKINSLGQYLALYRDLFRYLDIDAGQLAALSQMYGEVTTPEVNRTPKEFEKRAKWMSDLLRGSDVRLTKRLKLLGRIECTRLFEAMRCLKADCHLSSVVMAVSAVEYRLHQLVKKEKPVLYKKVFCKATLGGLIDLFRDDAYKEKKYSSLKKLLPQQHKPLVEMLNIYRIFSAHPKDEVVSHQTAEAILSLSFLLLVDERLLS